MELCLGLGQESAKSLWIKISRQTNMDAVVVCISYRPPDQEGDVDDAFFQQLEEASCSQVLVLMGEFNHPDICQKGDTAGLRQIILDQANCPYNTEAVYVDERRAMDVIPLDFSQAFDIISHSIHIWKLRNNVLDKWAVRWVEN
ncbi:hypothetical protein QYF61_025365 [Mycteria americana]|uniref:Endonuclease/exonuclease/phosphatase domain-containing protein n=1 Tax=Mycteria americana TaxID=33587 RepID=A0AAN7S4C3_MYCAM|nr:hypothetical protein QYF61_025365 [Mycteria americana]